MRGTIIRRAHRGQLSMIALIALSVLIIGTLYMFLTRGQQDRDLADDRRQAENVKEEQVKIEQAISSILDRAIHQSAEEMALHAGFTEENAPLGHPRGIPYLFDSGKKVNVPTVEVMQVMMAEEVSRRVAEERDKLKRTISLNHITMGVPNATVELYNESIRTTLALPLTVLDDKGVTVTTAIKFDKNVPLRLKTLRDLAVTYIEAYIDRREIEDNLLMTITQDSRIWGPNMGMRALTSCGVAKKVHHIEMIEPFRQNAQLAVALELDTVRSKQPANDLVAWTAEVDRQALKFTLLANKDTEKESTDVVEEIAVPTIIASQSCFKRFSVVYNVTFPVEMRIRDLMKSAKVVGGEGSAEVKPLEFVFYIRPFLREVDIKGIDESVSDPEEISHVCQGSCTLDIGMVDSSGTKVRSGTVYIDSCPYVYPTEGFDKLQVDNAPCNIHTLVAESTDPTGKARYVERVNILATFSRDITILDHGTVKGTVAMRNRVFCINSRRVDDRGTVPLGYVDGKPPTFIEIVLSPLNPRMSESLSAIVDENGQFTIEGVVPGRYLALFVPSMDRDGRPGWKVLPYGEVLTVSEGTNDLGTVTLDPMLVEPVGDGGYERIARKESC